MLKYIKFNFYYYCGITATIFFLDILTSKIFISEKVIILKVITPWPLMFFTYWNFCLQVIPLNCVFDYYNCLIVIQIAPKNISSDVFQPGNEIDFFFTNLLAKRPLSHVVDVCKTVYIFFTADLSDSESDSVVPAVDYHAIIMQVVMSVDPKIQHVLLIGALNVQIIVVTS